MPSYTMPGSRRAIAHAIGCVAIVALAACEQSRMMAPTSATPVSAIAVRATLNCVVAFGANRTVSSFLCGPPGQAPTTNMLTSRAKTAVVPISKTRVILSQQGTDVTVAFSGFTFVANVFAMNVTIQNLLTQPLGTTDGVTANAQGTRAVLTQGPTPTAGTGTITVVTDSGDTSLTAPSQPYFRYNAIIPPDSTSPASNWKFFIPPTATGIQFQIEVTAQIPAEESVTRWVVLRQGMTDSAVNSVWQDTPTDIIAVGDGGSVLHYNGSAWSTVAAGFSGAQDLNGVFGFSGTDVWTVGLGLTAHFDGTAWTPVAAPAGTYFGVWGSGTADVYAVGTSILHNTGSGWSAQTNPTTHTLRAVWGSDASHVWAVGDSGTILMNSGLGVWTPQTSCTTTASLRGVWGSSATNVYAVGGAVGTACHFDGISWSAVTLPVPTAHFLEAVGGSSATDVWITAPLGLTYHFNGTAWTAMQQPVGTTLLGITSGSASSVAIVGAHGTLLNFNGTSFVLSPQAGLPVFAVWATDTNNIYASSVGTILHYNGSSWSSAFAGAGDAFHAMSGTSNTDIYAVGGSGSITHFNGAAWSLFFVGGHFNGVWDIPGQSTIYAVGDSGLLKKGNAPGAGSFASQTPANPGNNLMAVWAVTGGNIFIVDSSGIISNSSGNGVWTDEKSTGAPLYAINGLQGVDQWAVGAGGAAWRLTGTTWASIPTATTNTLRGVWDAFAFDVYAVGDGGVIQHGNVASWLAMGSPVTTNLRGIYGTAQAHIYVGGDNGVILFGTR